MAMQKKLKAVWIKALTGGSYKQSSGALILRDKGKRSSYCCLGVLCRVGGYRFTSDGHPAKGQEIDLDSYVVLGNQKLREFGLMATQMDELVELNDEQKYNFKQIAAWIKKNIKVSTKRK